MSSLLIIALADNISDSLSIHVYQESENLEARAALRATLTTNFVARLLVGMSFVGIVLLLPPPLVTVASLAWGALLLAALTLRVARQRKVSPVREILKHVVAALAVVAMSRILGGWIVTHVQ